MLLGTLGGGLLGNILIGRGAILRRQGRGINRAGKGWGREINRAGEAVLWAGYGSHSSKTDF